MLLCLWPPAFLTLVKLENPSVYTEHKLHADMCIEVILKKCYEKSPKSKPNFFFPAEIVYNRNI